MSGFGRLISIISVGIPNYTYLFYLVILAASDIVVLNPVLHLFGWRFQPATLQMELGVEEVIVIVPPKDRLILGDQKLSELSGYGMYLLCENG